MTSPDGAATRGAPINLRQRNVKLVVLRTGVEIDGVARVAGTIVLRPREIANRLLASGACDFAERSGE